MHSRPDEVGSVAVEAERMTADLVAAGGRVVRRLALVGDVAEQVTLGVLRPRLAEVSPDAPVDPRRVLGAEAIDVERADAPEAATVDELAGEVVQQRRERGQREVVGGHVEHVVGPRAGVASASSSSAS